MTNLPAPTTDTPLDWALWYAARGWPVFPIKHKDKIPLTVKGFKEASTDEKTIRAFWTRYPNANIGLPTGAISGLAVIDIDERHGGEKTLQDLIEQHEPLPDMVESLTGGGGRHLIFKYFEGFRNSAGKIGPGIDTRGDGGYIVAPPSVHASGKSYAWEASSHPSDVPLPEMPSWLRPGDISIKQLAPGNIAFSATPLPADGKPVEVGGRNMAAASLAGQHLQRGVSLHEVMRLLDDWNKTNPTPLSDSELKRTLASVSRTHLNNNPAATIPVVAPVIEVVPEVVMPVEIPKPADFPEELLLPPGFVGEITKWINDTAYMPQPALALGNALAFFGAVIGRKVATPTDLRSNLYILGVGDSGCGKDHSRKCIKRICDTCGLTEKILGGEEVTSDSAILATVYERPSILFQFDEIGHMLAQSNSKYAASHERRIPIILTKLFSSANSTFIGKEYAGREDKRKDIQQPNVCIYGTTVPERLYSGITPSEIRDGFLGRMLIFQSNSPDPIERDTAIIPVPDSIKFMAQAWFQRTDLPKAEGNINSILTNVPMTVHLEPDADAELKRFRAKCRKYKTDSRGEMGLDSIWARAVEHAAKVAMVIACGCEFQAPLVSGEVMAYSVALVEYLIIQLMAVVDSSVAATDHERDLLYVRRIIANSGISGVDHSALTHRTRRLNTRTRQDILNQLVTSGDIILKSIKRASGPSATHYIIKFTENNC